jgi:hypothetical protein
MFNNIEIFNIPKFIKDFISEYLLLELVKAHLPEIRVFSCILYMNVVLPLL